MTDVLDDVEVLGPKGSARNMAHVIAKCAPVLLYDVRTAVDLTPGAGGFWSEREPIPWSVVLSPHDFLDTPYDDQEFDGSFFDPPHAAGLGKDAYFRARYGTYKASELPGVIVAGAREAWRIARLACVIKVTDHVNSARYQRQSGWVIDAIGIEPYQVITVVHGAVGSRRWTGFRPGEDAPQSARSVSSTLLIFRRGNQTHSAPARRARLVRAQTDHGEKGAT